MPNFSITHLLAQVLIWSIVIGILILVWKISAWRTNVKLRLLSVEKLVGKIENL